MSIVNASLRSNILFTEPATLSTPAFATALAGTVATNWLVVIELGIKGSVPKKTCVVFVKFVPVSVREKSLEPAVNREGLQVPVKIHTFRCRIR